MDANRWMRWSPWMASVGAAVGFGAAMFWAPWCAFPAAGFAVLAALGLHDLLQTRHSVRRNYPILGRFRYLLEGIGPEMRQYFIESDTAARPFTRNQRSLVYQRGKKEADKSPFGTQLDTGEEGYEWLNHSLAPRPANPQGFRTLIGADANGAPNAGVKAPYLASVFNISAMSFGSLSANAILALNQGAKLGTFAHDTGEGSVSRYHREGGGDLIWEIGSGYFGCRDDEGRFDPEKFKMGARSDQVKMIEVKLSQGAKPGQGGILPGPKVSAEIAAARGVPEGRDCVSPAAHSAFSTPKELLSFMGRLRELSGGKPVGFKLCVGHPWEFFAIAKAMLETGTGPDFIVVDGSEGGTGAAPVEFADHVGTPLMEGLRLVHNTLVGLGLRQKVKIGASGKIVSGFDMARVMACGADWCNSARGFMFALGCIQSMSCHTDRCPTGVATQDASRQKALHVPDKTQRVYEFHKATVKALAELVAAAGLEHPSQLTPEHVMRRGSGGKASSLARQFKFIGAGSLLEGRFEDEPFELYWDLASADSFAPRSRLAQEHDAPS
jgi:glutamate synthase domain-containing protein 2